MSNPTRQIDLHRIHCRFNIADVQMRDDVSQGGKYGIVEGITVPFGEISESYNEQIQKGAFRRTINAKKGRVAVFYMHDPFNPDTWIGMGESAEEQEKGVWHRKLLWINSSASARTIYDAMALCLELKRPAGDSIGFLPRKWKDEKDGPRTVTELEWYESSITPPDFQAYAGAHNSEVRSSIVNTVVECLIEMGVRAPALDEYRHANDQMNSPDGTSSIVIDPTLRQRISDLSRNIVKSLTERAHGQSESGVARTP